MLFSNIGFDKRTACALLKKERPSLNSWLVLLWRKLWACRFSDWLRLFETARSQQNQIRNYISMRLSTRLFSAHCGD